MPPSILKVNFSMFKVTKAKLIFLITHNYLALLFIISMIYFIVLGLYYFKIHLKLFDELFFIFIIIYKNILVLMFYKKMTLFLIHHYYSLFLIILFTYFIGWCLYCFIIN